MYDVAIIGAGVTGGMLARALAAYDLKICILEKENDVAMGATRANSGIVHAGYDAEEGTLKARLNVRGSRMMEQVARELGVPYRNNGSMVIGFGDEDREVIEKLYARGLKNGVKNLRILDGDEARQLEPGLSQKVSCVLHAPTCAIICPYELAIAAIGNAMDNGVELMLNFRVGNIVRKMYNGKQMQLPAAECSAEEAPYIGSEKAASDMTCYRKQGQLPIVECGAEGAPFIGGKEIASDMTYYEIIPYEPEEEAKHGNALNPQEFYYGTSEDSGCNKGGSCETETEAEYGNSGAVRKIYAKYVINAAGVNSDEIAALAGDDTVKVHPRKGEYLLLDRDCGGLISHTVFRTPSRKGKGILITPTVDGNLLLGPTSVDQEDKEDTAATAEGFSMIMEQARENVPSIPLQKTITSFSGLRAVGNTGDFIITSPKPGFINAAGIESPGLTAAPAIAEYIVEMLEKQGLVLHRKENWQPVRRPVYAFREASAEEKNKMIRKDRAYGRVVCRCETVTEGEILAAIRTNPPARDLDGIKRRTRAQMGRCQGGFCMPYIAELLARELGIPYEEVTKSGKGSEICVGRIK